MNKVIKTSKRLEREAMIANLNKAWPEAKFGKTSLSDLLWLTEISRVRSEDAKSLSDTMGDYRKNYTKAKDYAGRPTLHSGDDLAKTLLPLSPDEVVGLAERVLGFDENELAEKYSHLNAGQRRMTCGNKLRFALKKETITLADVKKAIK